MPTLTVIITASFIPSHPATTFIREAVQSLRLVNLPADTEIILAHDHSRHPHYTEYLRRLTHQVGAHPTVKIVGINRRGYLVGNLRNALQYVRSKYILVMQHDLPFVAELDIQKVIEDMEANRSLKHVRFNKRRNIKKWCDSGSCPSASHGGRMGGGGDLFGLQVQQKNYTYTRTPAWSAQTHLCLTSYYADFVMKVCSRPGVVCKSTERELHGRCINEHVHSIHGTYLFGELNHPQVIKHTDGCQSHACRSGESDWRRGAGH